MLEHRPREHDPVEERDGQAGGKALGERPQRAARCGAVDEDLVRDAGVERRDDERLAVGDEAEVRDETRVEHGVDRSAVVAAALGEAADPRAGRGGCVVATGGHRRSLRADRRRWRQRQA